jgi:hypothetical protein
VNIAAQVPEINLTDLSLSDLARQINVRHANVRAAKTSALAAQTSVRAAQGAECKAAMDTGDALIPANKKVDHGCWIPWLRKHTKLNARTAARYMQLARARPAIEAVNRSRETDLSITQALRLIEAKKDPPGQNATTNVPALTVPTEIDSEAAAKAWVETFLKIIPPGIRDALERRLVVPPTKTAQKRRRDDERYAEKVLFQTREEALEAVRESRMAKDRDKRSAEADARRAKFYDANAEPTLN